MMRIDCLDRFSLVSYQPTDVSTVLDCFLHKPVYPQRPSYPFMHFYMNWMNNECKTYFIGNEEISCMYLLHVHLSWFLR